MSKDEKKVLERYHLWHKVLTIDQEDSKEKHFLDEYYTVGFNGCDSCEGCSGAGCS